MASQAKHSKVYQWKCLSKKLKAQLPVIICQKPVKEIKNTTTSD